MILSFYGTTSVDEGKEVKLLFAACASDDATDDLLPKTGQERVLTVVVEESPYAEDDETAGARVTKGTEITTSTLSSFDLNYQDNQQHFTKGGNGTWTTGSWPTGITEADWYAVVCHRPSTVL